MVYDSSDPWAAAAAPVIRDELEAAGLDTTLLPVDGRHQDRAGAGGTGSPTWRCCR